MLLGDKQDCFKGDGGEEMNIFIHLADLDLISCYDGNLVG
jgi:hypothetical protein